MTEKTARKLERLLTRLLAVLEPKATDKHESAAEVSVGGKFYGKPWIADGGGADIPSQLTDKEREALEWQRRPRRTTPGRSHVESFRPGGE
jgi:hypothetical protein